MKILIVDDESLIRKSILRSIKNLGIYDTFEACDGIEAIHAVSNYKPDMILADIRMPAMDGLELLLKVKELDPTNIFVFISGYDLFEYAQKAVALGAFGYLLKPVKDCELKYIIDKATFKLAQIKKQSNTISLMRISGNEGLAFLRRNFILELLSNPYLTQKYMNNKLVQNNIYFTTTNFCTILICIDNFSVLTTDMTLEDKELVIFSVENIATEIMQISNISAYPYNCEDDLGYLINLFKGDEARLYDICNTIKDSINKFLHYSFTIGIGRVVNNLSSLNQSLITAQNAVAQKLIKGYNHVFSAQGTIELSQKNIGLNFNIEHKLLVCFENCDKLSAFQLIHELYLPFKDCMSINKSSLTKLNYRTIILLYNVLDRFEINSEELLGEEFKLYKQSNAIESIDDIIKWFQDIIELSFTAVASSNENSNKKVLDKAKKFIHNNYNKDITLDSTASSVHLNPSYFSRMFKQEIGINFIDYVSEYRIKKAKELLRDGIYKVKEISKMIGFNDEKYFYKVFKKLTGSTPSKFKKT